MSRLTGLPEPAELGEGHAVLVLGAGPGGLSAALWARRLGMPVRILEARPQPGGQLCTVYGPIPDYLGLPAKTGAELVPHFVHHVTEAQIPILLGAEVERLEPATLSGGLHGLWLKDGRRLYAPLLILAPGTRTRTLDVPGELSLLGLGVSRLCSRDKERVSGARVVVVGGGDAALEGALLLAERAASVTVVHRGALFRARPDFLATARAHPRVRLMTSVRVLQIEGTDRVERVVLQGTSDPCTLETDYVFIRIGVEPCTRFLRDILTLDAEGYGVVDPHQETSVPGIFMVGDACSPGHSSVANATGQGMIAAKSAERAWRTWKITEFF